MNDPLFFAGIESVLAQVVEVRSGAGSILAR
jgi:hypothetical protein